MSESNGSSWPTGKPATFKSGTGRAADGSIGPVPMPAEPRGLAFRPDGRTLAVVCADYRVVLVDPATGPSVHNLDPGSARGPRTRTCGRSNGEALFSPDGRFLLDLGARADPARLESGQRPASAYSDRTPNESRHAAFNPAAPHDSGHGRAGQHWSESGTFQPGSSWPSSRSPRWVQMLAFSPDGTELISGCSDGLIRSWDWRTGDAEARRCRSIPRSPSSTLPRTVAGWSRSAAMTVEATDWRTGSTDRPGVEKPGPTPLGSRHPGRRPPGDRRRVFRHSHRDSTWRRS